MKSADKPLRWMVGTLCTPPVGRHARVEAGTLLRRLQRGEALSMPFSRPMSRIGRSVHELRVADPETQRTWRLLYRIDRDAILVVHWFEKATQETPEHIIVLCRRRLARYDRG